MRGIVLAGGTGSRMGLSTRVVNKHCLPVYDKPMIQYALDVLYDNGMNDDNVTIVTTAQGMGQIPSIVNGDYNYRVQNEPGGIPQAIACARDNSNENVAVILGDNIFLQSPPLNACEDGKARCFLSRQLPTKLYEFGVPEIDGVTLKIKLVHEKPAQPPSHYAVTGLYIFGPEVFDVIEELKPSTRGEYEVADLLNHYARRGMLEKTIVEGFWGDAGTPKGLLECANEVANTRR